MGYDLTSVLWGGGINFFDKKLPSILMTMIKKIMVKLPWCILLGPYFTTIFDELPTNFAEILINQPYFF